MTTPRTLPGFLAFSLAAVTLLASCGHHHLPHDGEQTQGPKEGAGQKITNRITLPPGAVNNLGITFAKATRGKVGSWLSVPGELYVPDTHRWKLRAPTGGRITKIAPQWKDVYEREVIAEILSPGLRHAQHDLHMAINRSENLKLEIKAAEVSLHQGSIQRKLALDLQGDTSKRFNELKKLSTDTTAFGARDLLSAQREFTEASIAAFDLGLEMTRLRETEREKKLLGQQARLKIDEATAALALVSGRTLEELLAPGAEGEAWKSIDLAEVRAPAAGTIVEVFASQGEKLDENQLVAIILDPSELRFRGWLPEGDLPLLKKDAAVRISFPGDLPTVTTSLLGTRPVAEKKTRRVSVEARVPNPGRKLPEGLSASARVLVSESANEEVLLPLSCIVSDGLEKVVFIRDREKTNVVIRTPVELGLSGGGFAEVISGLLAGDTVVDKGKHQLKQAGQGKAPKGGHFHADGTWHLKDE